MSALPINIGDLSILVHGYEFPDIQDYWDGNWLEVDVWCEDQGKRAGLSRDSCLRVPELIEFRRELENLAKQRKDMVSLDPMEPYLGIEIVRGASLDRVSVKVKIMHELSIDYHFFRFDCALSDVDGWIEEIGVILKAFPQRGDISNVH